MQNEITVNLSRVGKNGSGLYVFSRTILECLAKTNLKISLITSDSTFSDKRFFIKKSPSWVAFSSKTSRIKPILWSIYSQLFFNKTKNNFLFSTTHHGIFGVKNQIITIHDLRPYFHPNSVIQKIYFRYILPQLLKNVSAIFTVSETSKKLIAQVYKIELKKIFVIPNSIEPKIFSTPTTITNDLPYLLMVGASWPHKNAHEVLLNHQLWPSKVRLKIVLGKGYYRDYLGDLIAKYNLKHLVDLIDYVEQEHLVSLYRNASAFIYPSLDEGFGIPPLEAMLAGTPVICSNIKVFKEVYEDAAIYVDLGVPESWNEAFKAIQSPTVRKEKISLGFTQAKKYNFENTHTALIVSLKHVWPELF